MAEQDNKITVGIEAEVGPLVAGLKRAETEVKASAKRMEAIAAESSRKMGAAFASGTSGRRVTRSFQPYGVSADSAFGTQSEAVKSVGREMAKVAEETKRASKPLEEMSRMTALIGRGLAAVNAGVYAVQVSAALARGEFDGISEAIRSAPLGLGQFVGLLEDGLNYALGINAALYSESAGKARQAEGLRRAQTAEENQLALKAAELRLSAETAATDKMRESLQMQAKLLDVQRQYQGMLNAANERGASESERNAIIGMYELAYAQVIAEYERKKRESNERMASDTAKAEADALFRANAEAARLIEINRREARRKRYEDNLREVRLEMDARREEERALQDELAKASAVRASNFMRSVSGPFGEFKFAQGGAATEVNKAMIRSADLLAKIEQNTKAQLQLQKEADFISSLK